MDLRTKLELFINPLHRAASTLVGLLLLLITFGVANKLLFKVVLTHCADHLFLLTLVNTALLIPVFHVIARAHLRHAASSSPPPLAPPNEPGAEASAVGDADSGTAEDIVYCENAPLLPTVLPDLVALEAEQQQLSMQQVFILLACLDTLGMLLHIFASERLPGPLIVLLGQTSIPITMFVSIAVLRIRYGAMQWVGATVIVSGILAAVAPKLSGSELREEAPWILLFVMGVAPGAVGNVLREKHYKRPGFDAYSGTVMTSLYSVVWLLLLVPIVGPSPDAQANFRAGVSCWLLGSANGSQPAACDATRFIVTAYLAVNLCTNVIFYAALSAGSAAVLVVAGAVQVPLTNILFSFPSVVGSASASTLSKYDVLAMVLITLGIVLFRCLVSWDAVARAGQFGVAVVMFPAQHAFKTAEAVGRVAARVVFYTTDNLKSGVTAAARHVSDAAQKAGHTAKRAGPAVLALARRDLKSTATNTILNTEEDY